MQKIPLLALLLLLSAALPAGSAEKAPDYEVLADGHGGYVFLWTGRKAAFVFDRDGDGRPDLTTHFWGGRAVRASVDADGDGRMEFLAVFSKTGLAKWYEVSTDAILRPAGKKETKDLSRAKRLLAESIVRRIAIDDGRLALSPVKAGRTPSIEESGGDEAASFRLVFFENPGGAPSAPKSPEKTMPIRVPEVSASRGAANLIFFPDLSMLSGPFENSPTRRLSLRLFLSPYRTFSPSPKTEGVFEDRLLLCARIVIEGKCDEDFCFDFLFKGR